MAYSDNLYSAYDDSDSDDQVDPLSPSDGYFATSGSSHVVPNVPNVMVPDPTLRDQETAGESKAREADQERRLHNLDHGHLPRHGEATRNPQHSLTTAASALSAHTLPTSPATNAYPAYTSYSYTPPTSAYAPSSSASASASQLPRRTVPFRGRSASVYSDAPPAYTPSATSPLSPTNPAQQNPRYGTVTPSMGIENEHLLGRGPESMAPPHDEEAAAPPWNRRVRRRLPAWLSLRTALLASVLMIASVGFLASSYRVFKTDGNRTIKPQPPPEAVVTPPGEPQTPAPSQPGLPVAQPLQATYCSKATYRFPEQIMAVDFSQGRNLSFVQDLSSRSGLASVRIGGQVNIRKLDQGGYPRVLLEIVTNDKDMRLDVLVKEAKQVMRITAPKRSEGDAEGDGPCVEMRATIYVPEGGELQLLGIKTTHLDILLLDDLSLKVTSYSRLESDLGDILSAVDQPRTYTGNALALGGGPDFVYTPAKSTYTFDSRIIEVHNVVGNIGGTWPLYDVLGLHTTGGNTQVSIAPQPALASAPKSAVLSLSSVSGSISATEPIHVLDQMPVRDYLVDLHSTSGKIRGALAFGMGIELRSTASDLAVDLLPVLDVAKVSAQSPAQLETGTTSGTTAVRVLDPVWYGPKLDGAGKSAAPSAAAPRLLDCLQAVHKSTSGNIGLKYPQAWAGDFAAESTAGTLHVRGPGVKVTKSTGGWGRSELRAYRGSSGNASTIIARTMIGNIDCSIGSA